MTEPIEEARTLAALAGLTVPPERLATLAAGHALTKRIAESLATVDLTAHEPAAQFRAPSSTGR
jgi:hypothetical protein